MERVSRRVIVEVETCGHTQKRVVEIPPGLADRLDPHGVEERVPLIQEWNRQVGLPQLQYADENGQGHGGGSGIGSERLERASSPVCLWLAEERDRCPGGGRVVSDPCPLHRFSST